jgi:nucleoside-diphosphate-sugar epimerase
MGPNFVTGDFTSGGIISKILMGGMPGTPIIKLGIVDVRDCALAHLKALKVKEAGNNRFILVATELWFREIAEIL